METSSEVTYEWKKLKFGKFSASQIFHLMIGGTTDKKTGQTPLFGKGAISHITKMARQEYTQFNEDDEPETFAMKLGKMRESTAAAYYLRAIGIKDMVYYGGANPLFHLYNKDAGASPDLVMWKDEPNKVASFGGEMKCPSGDVHMEYLRNIKKAEDLKTVSIEYYSQVQFSMLVFRTDLWHWCSHNEYFPEKDRLLLIEVPADKKFQNELDARLSAAIEMKYNIINELKNRE